MTARLTRTTARTDDAGDTLPNSMQSEIRDGVVHRVQRLTVKDGRLLVMPRGSVASYASAE